MSSKVKYIVFFAAHAALISTLIIGLPVAQAQTALLQATDFDGDGLGDLSTYDPTTGRFSVRSSSTLQFANMTTSTSSTGDISASGDYDGDGRADAATYNRTTATYNINFSGGSETTVAFGSKGDIAVPGDYWGLGCTNLTTFAPASATWKIGADCDSTPGFTASFTHGATGGIPMAGDFDCDGLDDAMVYDPSTTNWSLRKSSSLTVDEFFFGLAGDIPLVMHDSNGCSKAGVYRPTNALFFRAESYTSGGTATGSAPIAWGLVGDRPGSFNVDAHPATDFTVYRPSILAYFTKTSAGPEFYIPFSAAVQVGAGNPSSNNTLVNVDVPTLPAQLQQRRIPGDYNRDGMSDYVVATVSGRTTKFDILLSNGSSTSSQLSAAADAITPGDFDGDGKTQAGIVTVNKTSSLLEWRYINSAGTESLQVFGQNGDQPIVGDLDCDGKDDLIVVRSTGGRRFWFVYSLATRTILRNGLEYGDSSDKIFVADPNGDSCDEIIVAKTVAGGIRFFYRGLNHQTSNVSTNWGLAGDQVLTPMDMDGDGKDNFIVVRPLNGLNNAFIHQRGSTGFVLAFGFRTDQPFTGFFGGANYAEMGAYRTSSSARTPSAFFVRRFDGTTLLTSFGTKSSILVRPDGTAVFPSGNSTAETGGAGCAPSAGTSKGWGGGAVWKPISESVANQAPAILLPRTPYCDLQRSNKLTVTILGKEGSKVTGFQKQHCNGANDSRSHYWSSKTSSELKMSAPITVKVEYQGKTECRSVPDPTRRYE